MHLSQVDCVYAVTFTDRNDGHRVTAAHFTDRKEAERFSETKEYGDDQRVVQDSLWTDGVGNYYKVQYTPVDVDKHVHVRSALKKLTDSEKRALGLLK